jgi:hypothetical protein
MAWQDIVWRAVLFQGQFDIIIARADDNRQVFVSLLSLMMRQISLPSTSGMRDIHDHEVGMGLLYLGHYTVAAFV